MSQSYILGAGSAERHTPCTGALPSSVIARDRRRWGLAKRGIVRLVLPRLGSEVRNKVAVRDVARACTVEQVWVASARLLRNCQVALCGDGVVSTGLGTAEELPGLGTDCKGAGVTECVPKVQLGGVSGRGRGERNGRVPSERPPGPARPQERRVAARRAACLLPCRVAGRARTAYKSTPPGTRRPFGRKGISGKGWNLNRLAGCFHRPSGPT